MLDSLFPANLFPRMLTKVTRTLKMDPVEGPASSKLTAQNSFFPQGPARPPVIPMPESFQRVLDSEWKEWNGLLLSTLPKLTLLYSFFETVLASLQVPTVDSSMAALSSSAVIPSEGEGGPKDPCDKHVEAAMQRDFQAAANTFRASAAKSTMARGAHTLTEHLLAIESKLSGRAKNTLRRIALVAAFAANSPYDVLQFNGRATAANIVARCKVCLWNWEVDEGCQIRLVGVPFHGSKLFGQALDPILIENKDKRKVLPSGKKEQTKPKNLTFRLEHQRKDSHRSKGRWNRTRFFLKGRPQGANSSNTSKTSKEQPCMMPG